jgi:tRNA nucleotidyltransferase (CCA-adding enzyme)
MVDVNSVLNSDLWRLRDSFRAEGFDLRLVGGSVRDLLLGLRPKDVDLHTDATPDECMKIYEAAGVRFEPTGLQHGTLSVIFEDVAYEITSLRTDVETDGRHATVAYTRDWQTDLLRRDFTMNAMSMTFEGELMDPFGGLQDLRAGQVVFVGDAETRIREDYLRILRWFRFRGRFGMSMNDSARSAVKKLAPGLANISRERVWSEVKRILAGGNGAVILVEMHELGVAEWINLPKRGVWISISHQVSKATRNPVTLMVAFFLEDAENILRKWKASNEEVTLARKLQAALLQHRHGPFYCRAVLNWSLEDALELAAMHNMDQFERSVLESWQVPVFPVNGDHLKAQGIKPGPGLGALLGSLKKKWAESGYVLTKEELLESVVV